MKTGSFALALLVFACSGETVTTTPVDETAPAAEPVTVECWGPIPQTTVSFWYRAELSAEGFPVAAEAEAWNAAYRKRSEGTELVVVQLDLAGGAANGHFEFYRSDRALKIDYVDPGHSMEWNVPECFDGR